MTMRLQKLFSKEELEVLQARAQRIAAPLQAEDRAGRITALMVIIQREKYALPMDSISAVYRDVAIVPVPCVPKFVAGITNVRGHLVVVLDLAAVLGLEGDVVAGGAMVVAGEDDASIGFRIETIGEVVELAASQMHPVSDPMNLAKPEYLKGIFPDGTALLNMKALLDDPRLVVDESNP